MPSVWDARACGRALALNALIDLFSMDGHGLRCRHAQPDLAALHAEYGDTDIVRNHHCFADPSLQD
jgi:hypothetical protein